LTNGSRAFRAFITLLNSQKGWLYDRVAAYDLTPPLFQALHVLAEFPDSTMREFSGKMFCDASNATGLVDRLETRGLAERRVSDNDRRAKVVRLTPAGARMIKKVEDAVWSEAPPAIAKLSAADQRVLREIIERALLHIG
jgi:MarR family transcriptional regulator, organic hydroperoxide resistance regulator